MYQLIPTGSIAYGFAQGVFVPAFGDYVDAITVVTGSQVLLNRSEWLYSQSIDIHADRSGGGNTFQASTLDLLTGSAQLINTFQPYYSRFAAFSGIALIQTADVGAPYGEGTIACYPPGSFMNPTIISIGVNGYFAGESATLTMDEVGNTELTSTANITFTASSAFGGLFIHADGSQGGMDITANGTETGGVNISSIPSDGTGTVNLSGSNINLQGQINQGAIFININGLSTYTMTAAQMAYSTVLFQGTIASCTVHVPAGTWMKMFDGSHLTVGGSGVTLVAVGGSRDNTLGAATGIFSCDGFDIYGGTFS